MTLHIDHERDTTIEHRTRNGPQQTSSIGENDSRRWSEMLCETDCVPDMLRRIVPESLSTWSLAT